MALRKAACLASSSVLPLPLTVIATVLSASCAKTICCINTNRIVILGAAGFIGYHLARYLHKNCNNEILLVDNFVRGINDADFIELVNLDRIKFKDLDLVIEKSYMMVTSVTGLPSGNTYLPK